MPACACATRANPALPAAFAAPQPLRAPTGGQPRHHPARSARRPRHPPARAAHLPDESAASTTAAPYAPSIALRTDAYEREMLAASQGVRTVAEMRAHISRLRRQKLSLLLADLRTRVRAELREPASVPPLAPLLEQTETLRAALLTATVDEPALRAGIRGMLWNLRQALQPHVPSQWLRTSLEVARSAFLDIPGRKAGGNGGDGMDEAVIRGEMYALMVENVLLEELRSLRLLEQHMNNVVLRRYPTCDRACLDRASRAAAALGIDDYSVRGKTRLADAVLTLKNVLQTNDDAGHLPADVSSAIDTLHHTLMQSLATDLSTRRPAGEAMLLRPRMDDIPNFEIVNQNILRGGQPTSRGLGWLSNYGTSVVIDLRGSDRQNQWEMPKCRLLPGLLDRNGDVQKVMTSCNIPIEDFCTPTVAQVHEFIELVDAIAAKDGVVFVHCKAGIGRTGTLIACWRIANGEPVDAALTKERLYSEGGGGLRQEEFVRKFASILQAKE